jgi:hypothetical protein
VLIGCKAILAKHQRVEDQPVATRVVTKEARDACGVLLGPDFLALEVHVAHGEEHHGSCHQAGKLRPNQLKAFYASSDADAPDV